MQIFCRKCDTGLTPVMQLFAQLALIKRQAAHIEDAAVPAALGTAALYSPEPLQGVTMSCLLLCTCQKSLVTNR